MDHFHYRDGHLFVEDVGAKQLAGEFGTPSYVYSRAALESAYHRFDNAWGDYPHRICYAVKANSNIAILDLLARLGAGFDIVSVGELERVLLAGGDPSDIVFSGVGKTADEIRRALDVGIGCFNIESLSEMRLVNSLALDKNLVATIAIRVNPNVDPKTHPYIATGLKHSKFGIGSEHVLDIYREARDMKGVRIAGIDCHIGSQITELSPFLDATEAVLLLIDDLKSEGIEVAHLNLGGGLGIQYNDEEPIAIEEYASGLLQILGDRNLELLFEPGRFIAGEAGILLTRCLYLKENGDTHFAIVDAGMNDLLRPSLYQAWQKVVPALMSDHEPQIYDVVGPVCEQGDFIARGRRLAIAEGDLLAVECCGAYGFVMSSNYNSRGRAAEVMVSGDAAHLIRERETIDHQVQLEHLLPS